MNLKIKKIKIHYKLHVGYTRFAWVTPEDWEREASHEGKGEIKNFIHSHTQSESDKKYISFQTCA